MGAADLRAEPHAAGAEEISAINKCSKAVWSEAT